MTSVLLMLLLPVIRAQRVSPVPSCPTSCVVCSEDAVICQRLAHIIDAPDSTQALLLTEGSISTVQTASLSDLSNITVIGLSHNHISELGEEAFTNLLFLRTLLLDHNLLTSEALQGGALTSLSQLEVLSLGHNLISMIQASWFQGAKALRSLKLEGNLLTSLDSGSFSLTDLRELESLDLSDNLIHSLDRNSFRGLLNLRTLDLSRNRLTSAPAEAFSYLSWLTNLNLDLNSWNCSCQLLELAAFLSSFIQQPDKTLYNGRRMVCVSADNPAVTTVLELTDANCVPSNQNITVQVETRDSVTPQLYARDLAITAVICFIGGVGLTLLVVLICYQVSRRKKLKESQRLKGEEEGSSTVANHHVNHLDFSERRRDIFLEANSNQPWNKEAVMDLRTDGHGGPFRSRVDENGPYIRCSNYNADAPRLNPVRKDIRMNGGMEAEGDRERRRVRMMMEEERRRTGQGHLNRDVPNKFGYHINTDTSSHLPRENSQRAETVTHYKTIRDMDDHKTDGEANSRGYEILHCESCHRTYRPPEQTMRQGRSHTISRDTGLFEGTPSQNRLNDRGRAVHHLFDTRELRRETRNVTFDLESLRALEQGNKKAEEAATSRDKEKGRERKHKVQSSRVLKVKLNLNPLRKSKIHPKRKSEQGHSEKSSSKKSKEKRKHGKEREEKEGKQKAGKNSSEKMRKPSKTAASAEHGESKEEEDGGEGRQKGKNSSKQKRTTSKGEQQGQECTEGENTNTDKQQPADRTSAGDQSASAVVTGHGQHVHGFQYQGAGLPLGNTQLSSQHPFSVIATNRNQTSNLSLLGSAGSQLTGSSLSLQGGNCLLNTMASGSNGRFPSGPSNSVTPSMALSVPNVAPSGAPESLSRSSVPSLLANTVHANPLQAGAIHTTPLQTSQARGLPMNLTNTATNPALVQFLSKGQMPPDSSPLVARPKLEPAGIQVGEGQHQLPIELQAPSVQESLAVQGQDGVSAVAPQNLEPVTTVENISNNNSQTEAEHVPGDSSVSMFAGGMSLTERSAVGRSGDSMQAAGVSVSGVSALTVSTLSGSSTGAAALMQQEYLSEEGGSSPRRKLRLVLPEKTSSRPPTALEKKIR